MRYEQKAAIQDNNKARIYAEKKNKHNVLIDKMYNDADGTKEYKEYKEKNKQDKLKQILAICETNKKVDWVSADMEVFEEFDVIIKLLKEVINE